MVLWKPLEPKMMQKTEWAILTMEQCRFSKLMKRRNYQNYFFGEVLILF